MKNRYEPISEKGIRERLQPQAADIGIRIYDLCDSTNVRAQEAAARGLRDTTLFITEGQYAGHGRMGRSFDSGRGLGLYMTILGTPDNLTDSPDRITLRAAVAVREAVVRLTGLSPTIKWVNDICICDKKLCGILAEGGFREGRLDYYVLGIGINLYQRRFSEELSKIATTVESEGGRLPTREALAAEILSRFFDHELNLDTVLKEYRTHTFQKGTELTVRYLTGTTEDAVFLGITDEGALRVRMSDGRQECLISAEVSVRKKPVS